MDNVSEEINAHWVGPLEIFKILAIEFYTDLHSMVLLNYIKTMHSLRNLITSWSERNLTVLGRITVVKSLLLSKLTFLILTIPDPPINTINDLNSMIFKFIWRGNDRVSRNKMVQDYSQGGLRMVDFRDDMTALKITWL